jgi:dihydroxyacetone kinase
VDPLAAFVDALSQDFTKAVKSAQNAAESTRDSDAKAGRSAYIESDRLRRDRVPDPGAWAVKVILENLLAV